MSSQAQADKTLRGTFVAANFNKMGRIALTVGLVTASSVSAWAQREGHEHYTCRGCVDGPSATTPVSAPIPAVSRPVDTYSEILGGIRWAYDGGNGPCTRVIPCTTWVYWSNVNGVPIPITRATGIGARDMIILAKGARMMGLNHFALGCALSTQIHNNNVMNQYANNPDVVMQVLDDFPVSEITGRDVARNYLAHFFPPLRPFLNRVM